ncbi:hypothetical protein MHN80_11335 [Gordonia McavH-238-E]|uniref:hypothetical protein n=1 Tax=Gordonia sp. McavH-238-E TaxID=2917736 RepID=UPI001EF5BB3E|nr:hypothetical protein [Gordonia sp. McavH-238-E]MCG7632905.1 hypothetical protein [Gordonia sp. McavH-238-E]
MEVDRHRIVGEYLVLAMGSRPMAAIPAGSGATGIGRMPPASSDSGEPFSAIRSLPVEHRLPSTDGAGLEVAGVFTDGEYVMTDDRLSTNLPGVYAVGDILAGPHLPHRELRHGLFIAAEMCGLHPVGMLVSPR